MREQSTPERKDVSSLLVCPHIQHTPQTGKRVPISHTFLFSQHCWYKVDSYVFYSIQMYVRLLFMMVLIEELWRWRLSQSLVRANYLKSRRWHTLRRFVSVPWLTLKVSDLQTCGGWCVRQHNRKAVPLVIFTAEVHRCLAIAVQGCRVGPFSQQHLYDARLLGYHCQM